IYRPTAGIIRFDDRVINQVPPRDRNIGMVFQSYALYPHMTVFGNIAYPLKLKKVPKEEQAERVREVAAKMGIANLLDRRPAQLSGGQQQRVALGRALVKQPDVLLFDEPLSNLDAKLRVQMRTEISKLHMRLQATMIYVTHDQVEAMTMGDRIVVMKDGVVQQVDDPISLYDH
ncbi:MAG: ABC transporter ATP-binding protein, partial [Geminicoccaceae bacterium]